MNEYMLIGEEDDLPYAIITTYLTADEIQNQIDNLRMLSKSYSAKDLEDAIDGEIKWLKYPYGNIETVRW